jgi:hypothetical protein
MSDSLFAAGAYGLNENPAALFWSRKMQTHPVLWLPEPSQTFTPAFLEILGFCAHLETLHRMVSIIDL